MRADHDGGVRRTTRRLVRWSSSVQAAPITSVTATGLDAPARSHAHQASATPVPSSSYLPPAFRGVVLTDTAGARDRLEETCAARQVITC